MMYFVKTPNWLKKIFPGRLWEMPGKEKVIYLSFDDGPHPEITPFVLDELKKYNAFATFFCIGKNVAAYPEVYQRILAEGHAVGNHTHNHPNAAKTKDDLYLQDVLLAKQFIDSALFRPPYGRISNFLVKQLQGSLYKLTTVMWTVLSADFDTKIAPQRCLENVILNAREGSIVVFHDSEKAKLNMQFALSGTLKFFREKDFSFRRISLP